MIECFGLLNLTLKVHYISLSLANAIVKVGKCNRTFEIKLFLESYSNGGHN